jgi:hypothetical protein
MTLNDGLDAVTVAIAEIKSIADLPGVNAIPYVATVSSALGAIGALIEAGRDITPLVSKLIDTFNGDEPSAAEIAELNAMIEQAHVEIQKPLPPAEPGEEE